jgi:hypothetical protein
MKTDFLIIREPRIYVQKSAPRPATPSINHFVEYVAPFAEQLQSVDFPPTGLVESP